MKARNFALCVLLILATDISAQKCFTPENGATKSFVEFLDALVEKCGNFGWPDYYICYLIIETVPIFCCLYCGIDTVTYVIM